MIEMIVVMSSGAFIATLCIVCFYLGTRVGGVQLAPRLKASEVKPEHSPEEEQKMSQLKHFSNLMDYDISQAFKQEA